MTNWRVAVLIGPSRKPACFGSESVIDLPTSTLSNSVLVTLMATAFWMAVFDGSGVTVRTYRSVLSTWFRVQMAMALSGASTQLRTIRTAVTMRRHRGALAADLLSGSAGLVSGSFAVTGAPNESPVARPV